MTPINKLTATVLLIAAGILPASGQQTAEEWFIQGDVLWEQGKYDEAIKCFDEAFRLGDPPNTEVLLLALVIMPASGQMIAEAWNNQGVALETQSKYDEAINAFDEAIRINPQFPEAWNNKGMALKHKAQGEYDEALAAFDEAIRINPQFADAWAGKGVALESLGRSTEAQQAYAKARVLYTQAERDHMGVAQLPNCPIAEPVLRQHNV